MWVCVFTAILAAGCAAAPTAERSRLDLTKGAGVEIHNAQLTAPDNSPLPYRTYQPLAVSAQSEPADAASSARRQHQTWVILAHGFLRDQDTLRGLATALAQAGFKVATLNFKHGSPVSGGHLRNSREMIALARHLHAQPVIYAGFSSGALAALLAGHDDPSAIGVLTLDLVDSQQLGQTAARGLRVPLVALTAEPSNCNANQNAAPIYASVSRIDLVPIPHASHCDFESPTDWLCLNLCKDPDGQTTVGPRQRIIERSVAGVRELLHNPSAI